MKIFTYQKKGTIGILILLLSIGSIPGISGMLQEASPHQQETISVVQDFSSPILKTNQEFIEVTMDECHSILLDEEKPMLPMYTKTYEFPIGTTITDISFTHSDEQRITLDHHITPAPKKQPISSSVQDMKIPFDRQTYSSATPYPKTWYSYTTGAGLNTNNEHVLFFTINIYPIHYIPSLKTLTSIEQAGYSFTYETPVDQQIRGDTYDLVIITPEIYSTSLQQLVTHKNNNGVPTTMVTLENIYAEYDGRDQPEQIKYFVKYAFDEWNIKYVLLVGDVQTLPIRITYASWWEDDVLSDLYYADIYDASQEFCSWDSNGNDRFGELNHDGQDIDGVDLFADVHIGRIACVDETELTIVIDKIITYETSAYGSEWFNKVILAGGDTFPPFYGSDINVFEGEITNAHVAQKLPDFEEVLLWSSKKTLSALSFNRAITKGAGFLSYAGHGFEHGWGTYRPNAMVDKMILYYMPFLNFVRNNEKLPIVFFDACLTAKLDFNIADLDEYYPRLISLLVALTSLEYDTSIHYHCFAWDFIARENGGAIATIGSTRTAYTHVNEQGVFGGAGYLDVSFFGAYEQGVTAGEMLTAAQNEYITHVGFDYFTIEEFILLGDPSLRVGGIQ